MRRKYGKRKFRFCEELNRNSRNKSVVTELKNLNSMSMSNSRLNTDNHEIEYMEKIIQNVA